MQSQSGTPRCNPGSRGSQLGTTGRRSRDRSGGHVGEFGTHYWCHPAHRSASGGRGTPGGQRCRTEGALALGCDLRSVPCGTLAWPVCSGRFPPLWTPPTDFHFPRVEALVWVVEAQFLGTSLDPLVGRDAAGGMS